MTNLLVIKEQLKIFYGKYEVFITPVLKLILALVSLIAINQNIGFMYRLKNPAIVLIIALLCSFLPFNMIIVFSALYIVLHVYTISVECAVVVLVLMLLMFLLYFRFSPKDTLAVLLTPLCFAFRIPYVVPLAAGFVGSPLSAVSVGCGVVIYYVLGYIKDNSSALGNLEADSIIQKFKYVVDSIINNKTMLVMVAAFAFTITIVYLIRRLSLDYSWRIAMIIGAITDLMFIFIGDLILDIQVSVLSAIAGTVVSVLVVMILQFFIFSVDYSRTEYVQFEDDEYYYYVKAVPKMMVSAPEKKVKRINPQKKTQVKPIVRAGLHGELDEDFDIR